MGRPPPWSAAPSYTEFVTSAIAIPLSILLAYLLGSVSFGVLVANSRGIDIRREGSGNPGVSNIMRVLGMKAAALVLVGDGVKGVAVAAIGVAVGGPVFGYVALLAAVVGHSFPIWHKFDGGKSVAAAIGGFIYLAPGVGFALAVVWLSIVVGLKKASIASLTVMAAVAPALWLTGRTRAEFIWAAAIALFVVFRHAGNIRRLATSSERSVSE